MGKNMKLGKDTKSRVLIYVSGIVFIYLLLIARLFYLQIMKNEYYKMQAEENRIKRKKIDAPRGKIYDREGKLLATNVAGYKLVYLKNKGYELYRKYKMELLAGQLEEEYYNIKQRLLGRKYRKKYPIEEIETTYKPNEDYKSVYAYELKRYKEYPIELKEILEENPYLCIKKMQNNTFFKKEEYYSLFYISEFFKEFYTVQSENAISEILEVEPELVKKRKKRGKKVNRYSTDIIISDDIPEKKAHKLMEILDKYPYLEVVAYPKRKYIYGNLASHVIGYVKSISAKEYELLKDEGYDRNDDIGKYGIEKYYDKTLQGKDGFNYVEVDVRNRGIKEIKNKEAVPGKDIYLSLDIELQKHITDFLNRRKAAFLAMDSKTGEIITAISSPEYDLNLFASRMSQDEWESIQKDPNKPLTNRISVGSYPPGSIYKSIVSFAILEAGVSPNERVLSTGAYRLGGMEWKDWKEGGHGWVDMYDALEASVNTYYYSMGHRIGKDKIIDTSFRFGLGQDVDIDVYERKKGRIPTHEWKLETQGEPWYPGDTLNMSIGQGYVLVTPLQMLQAYNMIANKGIRYKAHYVKTIVEPDNSMKDIIPRVEYVYETEAKNFEIIQDGLRRVVTGGRGTSRRINISGIDPAAKTGSAQNAHYKETHGWVAGYAPYDDPEITFICFMEGAGHGGSAAGPIVKEFLLKYYEKKGRRIN
jgi:penicillin-binding protein 2